MVTPHHQINIQDTPNDCRNHGSLTNDRLYHGSLTNNHHNHGSLTNNHHNHGSLTNDPLNRGSLTNDLINHGSLTNDRLNHGSLTNERHNNGGLISGHQVRRDDNAKYNRHNAQESVTTRITKLICAVFLSILFTVGLVTFILWLSLRPHRPRFHIHEFSIPSLAETNGFSSAEVTFNMTARNPNLEIGIYYDTMNLTLYYHDQTIAETPLLFPFYQSPKNTAIIYGTLSGSELKINNARWMQFLAARTRGAVPFRIDVTSSIRFKVSTWDSRSHKMHANCEIAVGPNGMILPSDKEKKCPVYFT